MIRSLLLTTAVLACGGCASMQAHSEADALQTTLVAYGNAVRWEGWQQALAFVDPETLEKHPLSKLDMSRYQQFRVGTYTEQPVVPLGPHKVQQIVQIGLININTQTERTVVDKQIWRYDEKEKHWRLVSGLPDISRH